MDITTGYKSVVIPELSSQSYHKRAYFVENFTSNSSTLDASKHSSKGCIVYM